MSKTRELNFVLVIYTYSVFGVSIPVCVSWKSKKDNMLPLKRLSVQFTAAQNCGMLILVVPGSQTTLCTDPDSSLFRLAPCGGLYKVFDMISLYKWRPEIYR